MIKKIRGVIDEIVFIFLNYFVCNIPIGVIRRIIYKMFGMKIGKGTKILMKTQVIHPWKIKLGDHVYVNERCLLDGRGGIEIGSNTSIAFFSKIITASHDIVSMDFEYVEEKVSIGQNCSIFSDAIILPGTIIKDKAIIAAGSVVKRGMYEENNVYGGNPAKFIRQRKLATGYIQNSWKPYFR